VNPSRARSSGATNLSAALPTHFQVVIEVSFKRGIPVRSPYVFHHAL
jgi:hypothetical protein